MTREDRWIEMARLCCQSYRLLKIGTHWFDQSNTALAKGDRRAAQVATLAHGMTAAAHRNLMTMMGKDG